MISDYFSQIFVLFRIYFQGLNMELDKLDRDIFKYPPTRCDFAIERSRGKSA